MKNKKILYLFGLFLVAALGSVSFYLYTGKISENKDVAAEISNLGQQVVEKAALEKKEDPEVQKSPSQEGGNQQAIAMAVPSLDRPVNIPESTPPTIKEEITAKIKELSEILKQDSNLFNEWLSLGLLRKNSEDYEGARQAWEYASAIRPKNSVSFSNLGALYGYYLQNLDLAEKNYLKAIENDPKYPYFYLQTADFYLEVRKDKEKAMAILQKGLEAVPGDESLKSGLENL
ncbi:hypothetical protein HY468_05095 [Candidatus Roizmanbacteria bacterium]|nr:hypothetical protein [Candidatus Roizmanbacteria bacterium]